jgi:pyruvate dehydrogenase E2 component (dihydrolipoamide acetyltransferase)
MAKSVIMPRFGMTQEEAEIVKWLCAEGSRVEQGDPICEVTTDKVNMEVEAPSTGILTNIRFKEGETVPVTQLIAEIVSEQEYQKLDTQSLSEKQKESKTQPVLHPTPPPAVSATPLAQRIAAAEGLALDGMQGSGTRGKITREDIQRALDTRAVTESSGLNSLGKIAASPAARSFAKDHGIELENVAGTGPGGRVQGWDVRKYQQDFQSAALTPEVGAVASTAPAWTTERNDVEIIPIEGMRKTIAGRLQVSYQQAPHIFLNMEINMDRAIALRAAINPRLPAGREPVSLTAMIVKACALALRDQPLLNSHLVEDKIYRFNHVHIGMAVALEEGLIVPVIRDADREGLNGLGDRVADLSSRARQGKLRPDDVSGGTFTISNLGMFGIDQFTAIINPPQVGILAVGRIARRFVPDENDQPAAHSLMNVTLSADHRVIDGLAAARFLNSLRDHLENPNLLLD